MLAIFLDSETNGLNYRKHKIIDIAFKILNLKSGKLIFDYQSIIFQPLKIWEKSDPTSLKINGFNWEMVKEGKPQKKVSKEIKRVFFEVGINKKNSLFICQNPSFDRAFFAQIISPEEQERLSWPYHWLDLASMYWSLAIKSKNYPWNESLSKDAIAEKYNLPREVKPHRAMGGVEHLITCYETIVGFPEKNVPI